MARAVHGFAFSPGGSSLRGALRFPLRAAILSRSVIKTTSSSRLRALGRFWRWQIERRSGDGPVVVDFGQGGLLAVPRWSQIGGMIVATGSHEPLHTAFLDRLVRSGDVFVDVGANIGFYAIRYAVAGARVVAFEPTERAAEATSTSARLAGVSDRVRVEGCALADEDGEAWFSDSDDVGNGLAGLGEGRRVTLHRLDTLASQIPDPDRGGLTVLKVDAEGADIRVLAGAHQFIEDKQPVIMVEAWDGGHDLLQLLTGQGYEAFLATPDGLAPLRESFWQANVIAVSRDRRCSVQERLAAAPPAPLTSPQVVRWRDR
ncbi:MAG: FkbM family methyltransferase [Thermoleophilaceae bacterium]|nr:FkbM family methyltransferase [Thermoleophilaceae bacterium]